MKTVALFNIKGGVGKTAASVNLAFLAAASGYTTLLWDLDAQGASSWYYRAEPHDIKARRILDGSSPIGRLVRPSAYPRLDVLPAERSYRFLDIMLRKVEPPRRALARLLKPFSEQYSLAVLDCPPSLSHLADNVFEAVDLVLVPVIPTYLSLQAYAQLQDHFAHEALPARKLRPFFSMVDRRRQLHRELLAQPPDTLKRLLQAAIPYSASIERMGEHRAPLAAFAPAGDAALLAFAELWLETQRLLELHGP